MSPFAGAGRIKSVRIVALILLVVVILTIRTFSHSAEKPSIYTYTEGKTKGPWRDEFWFDKSNIEKHKQAGTANPTAASARREREDELQYLLSLVKTHGLTNEIPWFARRLRAKYTPSAEKTQSSLVEAKTTLVAPRDFVRVRVHDATSFSASSERDVLALPMNGKKSSTPAEVDASALMFGVATSYSRLDYTGHPIMHDWARWLTNGKGKSNGAGLVVALQEATETEVATIAAALKKLGIDATVVATPAGAKESPYAQVVTQLLRSRFRKLQQQKGDETSADEKKGAEKKYFALVDDDVFFPSMSRLLEKLAKFSPAKEHYISMPSERADWVVESGKTITYGGGAVFHTPPMLDKVGQLLCLQETRQEGRRSWDNLLFDCVMKHTNATVQVVPSLWNPATASPDEETDGAGYGGGSQPLTLHHYRNWHRFEAGKGHLIASSCGDECFLQRFLFTDNWVLVNGYTLTHYQEGVEVISMQDSGRQREQNPDTKGKRPKTVLGGRLAIDKDASHDPHSVKAIAGQGGKKTWRLLDAMVRDNGEVWQAYANRKGGGNSVAEIDDRLPSDITHNDEESSDVDSVIVLIWKPDGI
ncbi:hypothetical protein B0H63DRAFT_519466 [Podospora didyma]|uniref:Glycosyltransferase family 31 protein n=1 Tax=Podospora didyma TaxID=330526 RepID=A0AAE0U4J4_9PEZI|nr:hypothetical protein B0H63DRAFT_519466 [Podospora didyma]